MGPPAEELHQRHGALQGQPGPWPHLPFPRSPGWRGSEPWRFPPGLLGIGTVASGDLCPGDPGPDDPNPAGVDGECRWVRGCELPDRHGGLPAGGTLRVHRVQVSGPTSRRRSPARPAQHTEPPPPPRITRAGVTFDPTWPAEVSGVRVSGVSYLGNKLDFSFSEGSVTVEARTRAGPRAPLLEVELWPSQDRLPLPPGRPLPLTRVGARDPRCVPSAPAGPSPRRTQGLLSPLCRPDPKFGLIGRTGSKFCSRKTPGGTVADIAAPAGPLGPLDPQSPHGALRFCP